MLFKILVLLLLLLYSNNVISHSGYMLSRCSTSLDSVSVIMGNNPIKSTGRSVQVKRSNALVNDNQYVAGEQLTIHISNTANQYFFDTDLGSFSGGSCGNKRTISSGSTLTMPSDGDVIIKVGWTSSRNEPVQYNSITLTRRGAPTREPTAPPPTSSPTPSSYTLVTFTVSEKIQAVTSDALSTSAKENIIKSALEVAIKSSLEAQSLFPHNLYISSIVHLSSIMQRVKLLNSYSLSYTYKCIFILQKTSFSSSGTLYTSMNTTVSSSSYSTKILSSLQASGISSISSANSHQLTSISYTEESIDHTKKKKKSDNSVSIEVVTGLAVGFGVLFLGSLYYFYFNKKPPHGRVLPT